MIHSPIETNCGETERNKTLRVFFSRVDSTGLSMEECATRAPSQCNKYLSRPRVVKSNNFGICEVIKRNKKQKQQLNPPILSKPPLIVAFLDVDF